MRTVVVASLHLHARRYLAALLAVVVGVTFIVVTAALSSAVRDGLLSDLEVPYDGADVVVDGPSAVDAAALLAAAPESGADAWLVAWTLQQITHDGRVVDDSGDVGQVPDPAGHRWQDLGAGRFPERPGEAVVDVDDARGAGIEVGDQVRVGTGPDALDVAVVGLVDSPSPFAAATVYLLWEDLRRWQDVLHVSSVAWAGPGDSDAEAGVVRGLVAGAEPLTVDEFVQRLHVEVNNEVDLVAVLVLLFASVALVVAVIVINNTFAILFAQRARDFALLRCVGATRRQVVGSVRLESLALGVVAAVTGLLAGIAVGHGLVTLVRALWPGLLLGRPDVSAGWLAVAAAVGVGVTLVAAWLPTRRVVRVSPLAALRPDDTTSPRTGSGRLRVALGGLTVAAGVATLGVAVAGSAPAVLMAGGALTFGGVLLLGPVLVPALIGALAALVRRPLGPAGRLAGGNAVRNPRRTATTAAALLVGVTLTAAVLTGMASSRAAVAETMDRQHPVDVVLSAAEPLPDDAARRVAAVDGVVGTAAVDGTSAEVADLGSYPLLAVAGSAAVRAVVRGDGPPAPADGRIMLPWEDLADDLEPGDPVVVTAGDRELTLRVAGHEGWGAVALVSAATLEQLDATPGSHAVLVRAEDGTDPDELAGRLEAIARPAGAELENGLARRDYVFFQLDVMTGGVVGLLAVAVVIALVGIANTLGLSVVERGREHALLRALGLTRRQLRTMLAAEAVLLSVVATLLGTALGVAFAWAGVQALVDPVVDGARLVLPWGQLSLVVAVSGVAGLLAAVLPSRRAARVSPAAGLALD